MAVKRFMMPTDYTGELASNRVVGEVHELDNTQFKLVVPLSGFFYTHNLKVYDEKMTKLEPGTHYQTIYANEEVQMRTPGLEVCGALIIKPNVKTKTVSLTYNQVGGPYANYTAAIEAALLALDLDGREIDFANLKGLPEYFTTGPHAEDIGNVFGFEYVKHGIERLRETLERSGKTTNDQVSALLNDLIDSISQMFVEHAKDAKAHGTTANDVGAYSKIESDEAARLFREQIEAVREELQTLVNSQGSADNDLLVMQSKIRLLSRRVTVVSNVAMNAIRRMGGSVTVTGGGGGGGASVSDVQRMIAEINENIAARDSRLGVVIVEDAEYRATDNTLPHTIVYDGEASVLLRGMWKDGYAFRIVADLGVSTQTQRCTMTATDMQFNFRGQTGNTVQLGAEIREYLFIAKGGIWRVI
jgi:hypothetical protein